jgi:hypothetical protein
MPLSTLLPFALIVVIGIVVFYAAYRSGARASAFLTSIKDADCVLGLDY